MSIFQTAKAPWHFLFLLHNTKIGFNNLFKRAFISYIVFFNLCTLRMSCCTGGLRMCLVLSVRGLPLKAYLWVYKTGEKLGMCVSIFKIGTSLFLRNKRS